MAFPDGSLMRVNLANLKTIILGYLLHTDHFLNFERIIKVSIFT